MSKETNEVDKGEEIAIGGHLSSLRRKYLKGGKKFGKLGKGDLSMDAGEQVITIKKEIRAQKGREAGGDSSKEQETKLKKINIGDIGRESSSAGKLSISRQNEESKNDSKGQTKQTITKIEITHTSENKSGLRANKSVSNNSSSQNQKGGNSSKITKTTEVTTTTNSSKANQGNDRRSRGKGEVTTTTTKTTKTEGNISGKKEVVKTTITKEGGNSSRETRTKEVTAKTTSTNQRNQANNEKSERKTREEVTTTTRTTTSNQKNPAGRGSSTQNQVTTTKTTTTTTNTLRSGNDKKAVSSQSTSRINNKKESNKVTTTNQMSRIAQKSTPPLRGNNVLPSKENLKNDKKRPLSSIAQEPEFRNNIARIFIDETGKIPKKEYVLNVRKTDVIRRKNKIRMVYNNDPNAKKSVNTEFNHNIKVIKNVTKDLPTVESLPVGAKIIHRYNYSFNPNIPNTSRHEINETGKIPVKQVQVSPRKNNVIKTERKPLKMTFENYNSTHQGGNKIIPLPNNLKGKKGIEQVKKTNDKESKKISVKGDEGSKSTRIRSQASNNRNKVEASSTKVTETKTTRGRSEGGKTGGKTETKVTITKTTETKTGKTGNELKITKNANESGKKEGRGDRSSKKNKIEPVSTGQISVNESGKNNRNRSEGRNAAKKEEKITTSKVTVTKAIESSNAGGSSGSGSTRVRASKGGGSKEETKVTKTKTEGSKITTTTTTTKVETTEGGDGNLTKVKKFKSHRIFKK